MPWIESSKYTSKTSVEIEISGLTPGQRYHVFITNFNSSGGESGWLCVQSGIINAYSATITRGGLNSSYPNEREVLAYTTSSATIHVVGNVYSDSQLPSGYFGSSIIPAYVTVPNLTWAASHAKGQSISKAVTAEVWNNIKNYVSYIIRREGRGTWLTNTVKKGDEITEKEFNEVVDAINRTDRGSIYTTLIRAEQGKTITSTHFDRLIDAYNEAAYVCNNYY